MQRCEKVPIGFGYDESNNGRYPSIHVLAYSRIPQDFYIFPETNLLQKQRDHKKVNSKLRTPNRDYSFLLFTEADLERLHEKYKVLGVILGSLLFKESVSPPIHLYVDGGRYEREIDFAHKCIREVTGLKRREIFLHFGPRYDRRSPIVNLADEIANWLLRKKTPFLKLRDHLHRKPVIPLESIVR